MNCENIKKIFNNNGIARFKMYGLDYTIEKQENGVVVYADLYQNKKTKYNSIDELFEYYCIYNENIISNDSRIQNIS